MARGVTDPAVPDRSSLDSEIARLRGLDVGELRARWHTVLRRRAAPHLPRHLLFRPQAHNSSVFLFAFDVLEMNGEDWPVIDWLKEVGRLTYRDNDARALEEQLRRIGGDR
jgi:hypothetical protein